MAASAASEAASENVTLTTYYPAPSGVYTQMIVTGNAYLGRDGGEVGIGTASPLATFDVEGSSNVLLNAGDVHIGIPGTTAPKLLVASSVQVGFDASACGAGNAGAMRWNTGNTSLEVCNGTSWGAPAAIVHGAWGGSCNPYTGAVTYPATYCANTAWFGGDGAYWFVWGCAPGWTVQQMFGANPGSVTYTSVYTCVAN
jgi:hypothetical protein